jgi:hypothetical protein
MPDAKPSKPAAIRTTLGEAAAKVRAKIDSGKTGDKIKVSDPAASPLGTDAEAGSPHDEEGLKIAREASRKPSS